MPVVKVKEIPITRNPEENHVRQNQADKNNVRSDLHTLIERSFRVKKIEQDTEETIKEGIIEVWLGQGLTK